MAILISVNWKNLLSLNMFGCMVGITYLLSTGCIFYPKLTTFASN